MLNSALDVIYKGKIKIFLRNTCMALTLIYMTVMVLTLMTISKNCKAWTIPKAFSNNILTFFVQKQTFINCLPYCFLRYDLSQKGTLVWHGLVLLFVLHILL